MDWNYWLSDFLGGPLLGGITAVLQRQVDLDSISGLRPQPLVLEGLKLFLFGIFLKRLFDSLLRTGQQLFEWADDRFRPRVSISAEFQDGDITYTWVMAYMFDAKIWQNPRHIFVKSKSSHRRWNSFSSSNNLVDYVPHYGAVQFFRWRNHWMEISRTKDGQVYRPYMGNYEKNQDNSYHDPPTLLVKIYSRDPTALYDFVEECRLTYMQTMKNSVTVYTATTERYSSTPSRWSQAKVKHRRPLDSLLLQGGMIEDLLHDAQEFLDSESWYRAAGIPYRRGYLLYGPPGTGKTSTVYTLAGELGLEIYSLSLASHHWDDTVLADVVSQVPPRAILLIEDIDCAFPSREEEERARRDNFPGLRSAVTLSGLLNVLDGVGSEEGRLYMATTNYMENLDPALIRPGRIDRKMQYKYSNHKQTRALFMRFFHTLVADQKLDIAALADTFTDSIPEDIFSLAELQGFLLLYKTDANGAVEKVQEWVEDELRQRRDAEEYAEEKRRRDAYEDERRRVVQLQQYHRGDFAPLPPSNNLEGMSELGGKRKRRRIALSGDSGSPRAANASHDEQSISNSQVHGNGNDGNSATMTNNDLLHEEDKRKVTRLLRENGNRCN